MKINRTRATMGMLTIASFVGGAGLAGATLAVLTARNMLVPLIGLLTLSVVLWLVYALLDARASVAQADARALEATATTYSLHEMNGAIAKGFHDWLQAEQQKNAALRLERDVLEQKVRRVEAMAHTLGAALEKERQRQRQRTGPVRLEEEGRAAPLSRRPGDLPVSRGAQTDVDDEVEPTAIYHQQRPAKAG